MVFTPRWLTDEEQHIWRLLLSTMRKIDRSLDETLLVSQDLSSSEFAVLVTLSESPNSSMRMHELCGSLDWARSRASHQVTRMQRRGLVDKCRSEGDGRGVFVMLTEEGRRRLEKAAPDHVEHVRRLIFDHLTAEQATALAQFCTDVLAVDNVPGTGGCAEPLR